MNIVVEKKNDPPTELTVAKYVKIADLHPGTYGHNLVAKVISVNVVKEKPRVDGTLIKIAEVLIADETGCVILRPKNEQIDLLEIGSTIVIRNAKVELYKMFMRLVVTKWGVIRKYPDDIPSTPVLPDNINIDNKRSEVEYEIISSND